MNHERLQDKLNLFIISFFITSTICCGTHKRAGLQFKCVLTDNPPRPGEVYYTTGVDVSFSFRIVVWVLLCPTRTNQWKCCETGPYPRKIESLTVCRCHCKGITFSTVILRPWVLVLPVFEPTTFRSTDGRSPNWANQAAAIIMALEVSRYSGLLTICLTDSSVSWFRTIHPHINRSYVGFPRFSSWTFTFPFIHQGSFSNVFFIILFDDDTNIFLRHNDLATLATILNVELSLCSGFIKC